VISVRPKVAELSFHVFGRSLHPELFETHCSREFSRGGYSLKVDITNAGHVVTWQKEGVTLAEVAASAQHPLPQQRRLLSHRISGSQRDQIDCRAGVRYRSDFQLEIATPELFWALQAELNKTEDAFGVLHVFDSSGRISIGAVSYVHVELRDQCCAVRALHTFPDDTAVLRTHSMFELVRVNKTS
jgi:Protein of unknown function DUF2617